MACIYKLYSEGVKDIKIIMSEMWAFLLGMHVYTSLVNKPTSTNSLQRTELALNK